MDATTNVNTNANAISDTRGTTIAPPEQGSGELNMLNQIKFNYLILDFFFQFITINLHIKRHFQVTFARVMAGRMDLPSSLPDNITTNNDLGGTDFSIFQSLLSNFHKHFWNKPGKQLVNIYSRTSRVKLAGPESALNPPVVYSTDRSKAVVPVLVLLFVALWFILWGNLF